MCNKIVIPQKAPCNIDKECCGINLNTTVPFIWNCIEFGSYNWRFWFSDNKLYVNPLNAFPVLMSSLSKILTTLIMIFSFLAMIVSWIMMTNSDTHSKWRELITKVIIWLVILWSTWIILKLINPNIF
jgi:hypothetical protein